MPKINYTDIKIKEIILAEHTESQRPLNHKERPDITFFAINVWIQYLDIDGDVVFEERTAYKKDELPAGFKTVIKNMMGKTKTRVKEFKGITQVT